MPFPMSISGIVTRSGFRNRSKVRSYSMGSRSVMPRQYDASDPAAEPRTWIVGATEAFVDLGDNGRYTYKLTATVPAGHRNGIWRLSLQDIALDKLSGLAPFFSTSAAAFFRPDR